MVKLVLTVGVMHIALFAPHMTPLDRARNGCDSITATRWENFQSTNRFKVLGVLL